MDRTKSTDVEQSVIDEFVIKKNELELFQSMSAFIAKCKAKISDEMKEAVEDSALSRTERNIKYLLK